MKRFLTIIFVSLLFNGNVYADLYSNCYFDRISDPKFKSFERKSFNEMTGFLNHGVFIDDKSNRISGVPLPSEDFDKFIDIEFNTGGQYLYDSAKLKWSYIKSDGSIVVEDREYDLENFTENYVNYERQYGFGDLVLIKEKKEIQIKGYYQIWNPSVLDKSNYTIVKRWQNIKDNKGLTLFLKCEKYKKELTYTEKYKKKNKALKIENYNSLIIIIVGLLNLIVLSLLLWRTFRKNK